MSSGKVTEPYRVSDPGSVVGELMLGKFILFQHEYLNGLMDVDTWEDGIRQQCTDAGLQVEVVRYPNKGLTLVFSYTRVPQVEEVEEAVAQLEYYRMLGKELGTELQVKEPQHHPR